MTTAIRSFDVEQGTRWIDTKLARVTDTFVTVAEDLRSDAPEGCRWIVKCEDHGWVAWTETRRGAHQTATDPSEFCRDCASTSPVKFTPEFAIAE